MSDVPEKSSLRTDLEKLSALGQDIAKMSSKLPTIPNQMVYTAMKKSVDEMTVSQNQLVRSIVARSNDQEARGRFDTLGQQIDNAEQRVRDCNNPEELQALGQELEALVDQWVQVFQHVVADLMRAEKNASTTPADPQASA